MWLLGYDEHKSPLPPKTALEDVSSEHALKTVTIEPFPHSSLSMASVHPCKHSSVMKKVIERMDEKVVKLQRNDPASTAGTGRRWGLSVPGRAKKEAATTADVQDGPEGLRVDQYLVVFLKFMSTIVPTIEVDATNAIVRSFLYSCYCIADLATTGCRSDPSHIVIANIELEPPCLIRVLDRSSRPSARTF